MTIYSGICIHAKPSAHTINWSYRSNLNIIPSRQPQNVPYHITFIIETHPNLLASFQAVSLAQTIVTQRYEAMILPKSTTKSVLLICSYVICLWKPRRGDFDQRFLYSVERTLIAPGVT